MMFRLIRHRLPYVIAAIACLSGMAFAGSATAQTSSSGGAAFVAPPPPPKKAKVVNGRAIAPRGAPKRVKRVIAAGNKIIGKPYRYGGGHRSFSSRRLDSGYDCSGTVSFALNGGRFIRSPLPSGDLMSWGRSGPGRWITVYAHGGHAYMVVAGLRLDTGMRDPDAPTTSGPAWSKTLRRSSAFVARHPSRY